MQNTKVESILGGVEVLGHKLETKMDFFQIGATGITRFAVDNLADFLLLSRKDIARMLSITERTLQRYSPDQHLKSPISEQALHIAEAAARGIDVFGDKDNFLTWLNMPLTALNHEKPINLLSSRFGTELVMDELGRIEHGIYS